MTYTPLGSSLLAYAVVLGPGNLATFDVLCTAPVSGSIHVVDSAAQQSMVVLEDGRTVTGLRPATQIDLAVSKPAAKRFSGT